MIKVLKIVCMLHVIQALLANVPATDTKRVFLRVQLVCAVHWVGLFLSGILN